MLLMTLLMTISCERPAFKSTYMCFKFKTLIGKYRCSWVGYHECQLLIEQYHRCLKFIYFVNIEDNGKISALYSKKSPVSSSLSSMRHQVLRKIIKTSSILSCRLDLHSQTLCPKTLFKTTSQANWEDLKLYTFLSSLSLLCFDGHYVFNL